MQVNGGSRIADREKRTGRDAAAGHHAHIRMAFALQPCFAFHDARFAIHNSLDQRSCLLSIRSSFSPMSVNVQACIE